jgi:hypothetical protein
MAKHQVRFGVIAVLTLAALIGVIVLVALGEAEGTGFGAVSGALGTLLLAMIDASNVETRRRNPKIPAIADDVRTPARGRSSPTTHGPSDPEA